MYHGRFSPSCLNVIILHACNLSGTVLTMSSRLARHVDCNCICTVLLKSSLSGDAVSHNAQETQLGSSIEKFTARLSQTHPLSLPDFQAPLDSNGDFNVLVTRPIALLG